MNYEWDPNKNKEIQEKHGVSFEEIVNLIGRGFLIKTKINPSKKHKGQKIFLVQKGRAIFVVPFENRNNKQRLITAFYSQKYTHQYLKEE